MELKIPRDYFQNPVQPEIYLCTTNKKIISEVPAYDVSLVAKWNAYSELTFSIDRTYVDMLNGGTKVHPAFDKAEGLRMVYIKNMGYFLIQDPDYTSSDKDTKTLTCFSSEYTTGSKYLEEFRINTGDVDSKEVIYESNKYGSDAKADDMYRLAQYDKYDKDTVYYCREYENKDKYKYIQASITNEADYKTHFGDDIAAEDILYTHGYANVQFYDQYTPELSLLHLIFAKIPEWSIGHVDSTLWHKERRFDESRIAVYDFLMNNVSETFNCVVEWDTIHNRVNFYEEAEDGIEKDNSVQTRFDTDIFISKDNLANEINIKYSTDNIKTKLKVSGAEGLDIREINFGNNYLINLDYYRSQGDEWMEQDLRDAYDAHLQAVADNSQAYKDAVAGWVQAYSEHSKLMNAVPGGGGVVQIGDAFEKLYCMYTPIDNAYLPQNTVLTTEELYELYSDKECSTKIDQSKLKDGATFYAQKHRFVYVKAKQKFKCMGSMIEYNTQILIGDGTKPGKLELYHIDEDTKKSNSDNILLRLQKTQSQTATIRIWYDDTAKTYKIYKKVTDFSNSNNNSDHNYDITNWIEGKLTAKEMGLEGYKVTYIGTMGAYFVLAKDETKEENLQNYGIRLLEEKLQTYDKILGVQTEKGFANDKYKCYVGNDTPDVAEKGDKWLNTSTDPVKLYQYVENTENAFTQNDKEEMQALQEGGNVDLFNRPQIPVSALIGAGWEDVGDGTATVFTSTYSNEDETIAINVTPIISATRIMSPDELESYALAIIYDEIEDYEKIQIGPIFEGENAIADAVEAAERIHELQDKYYVLPKTHWIEFSGNISKNDQANYENYQRYIDNYNKKLAVERVLANKKEEAQYWFDGYQVLDTTINLAADYKYDEGAQDYISIADNTNVTFLYDTMVNTAKTYAQSRWNTEDIAVDKSGYDPQLPLLTFSYGAIDDSTEDTTTYAVYLQGTTPYVAYASSQAVYQKKKDYISNITNFESFFDDEQWIRLSPFIREDEFSDDNFLLTEYTSEEERLDISNELMDAAQKQLKTLSQPSLEFSMNMANILAIPEFEPLFDQFKLGNFVRVHIRDEYVKRARLLEVSISFNDLSDFSCTFGNLITTKSEVDNFADLVSQSITAGQTVASLEGEWQKAIKKTNTFEEALANGLEDVTIQVGRASGQAITLEPGGLYCRKYKDGYNKDSLNPEYEDEQIAIINNKLVFTSDNWETSKSAFGSFSYNDKTYYGLLAEAVIGGLVRGARIEGGHLEIGGSEGKFVVHDNGSVQILGPDQKELYAAAGDVSILQQALEYQTKITYEGSTVFSDANDVCVLSCEVYRLNKSTNQYDNITSQLGKAEFNWIRDPSPWTPTMTPATDRDLKFNQIKITPKDVKKNAQFLCNITFDDEKLTS